MDVQGRGRTRSRLPSFVNSRSHDRRRTSINAVESHSYIIHGFIPLRHQFVARDAFNCHGSVGAFLVLIGYYYYLLSVWKHGSWWKYWTSAERVSTSLLVLYQIKSHSIPTQLDQAK